MPDQHLILGVTRRNDDAQGAISGLIYRDGDKLRWGALDDLFKDDATAVFFQLIPLDKHGFALQALGRFERTVSGTPRFLFRRQGKLEHQDMRDALRFSEKNKALLKPQNLMRAAQTPLVMAYLEIARLSDVMHKDMLGGERALGQLAEVLGISASDEALNETLYELSRQQWVTVHELGRPEENAIALNKPAPILKL